MTDAYSLTVHNNSELDKPTFAVFAQLPATSAYETLSLAWFTQQIDQGSTYTFTWQIAWGFAWAATGTDTGVQWAASGSLPADPNSSSYCKAELDYDGAFTMTAVAGSPDGSHLWVVDSARVPLPSENPSSVAVTLSGNSACVTNAGPNLFQTYTLHPTYYIDAGNYVQGQMVDGSSVAAFEELAFTGGNQALTVTLNEDNTWTLQPTHAVEVASLFTGDRVGNGDWPDLPKTYDKTAAGTGYPKRNGKGSPVTTNITIPDAIKQGLKSWEANRGGTKYNLTSS